jgi:hypothetical protein
MHWIKMKLTYLLTFFAITIYLSGCTSTNALNAIPEKTNSAHQECGMYHLHKGMPIQQNLDRLITLGWLTTEQADRAASANVQIGDPECVAYAAYGLFISSYKVSTDLAKNEIARELTYRCENSEAPCPGVKVKLSYGKVVGLESIE